MPCCVGCSRVDLGHELCAPFVRWYTTGRVKREGGRGWWLAEAEGGVPQDSPVGVPTVDLRTFDPSVLRRSFEDPGEAGG